MTKTTGRCDWRCSRCGHHVAEFPDGRWRHRRLHPSSNVVPGHPGEVETWCAVHGGEPDGQGGATCGLPEQEADQ